MRHQWLLRASREEAVMECTKGKGDKEWREQKWEEGIIYKNSSRKVLSHWKRKAAVRLSFSFCLLLTHKPHTKTHSLSPPRRHRHHHNTYLRTHTTPESDGAERRGWGILLLYSDPVWYRYRLLSSYRLIKNRPVCSKQEPQDIHLFKTAAADWKLCS